MSSNEQLVLQLWLHRSEPDAVLVSVGGVGAGEWLPCSQIVMPEGAAPAALGPGGPFDFVVPRWLAEKHRLAAERDDRQGELL